MDAIRSRLFGTGRLALLALVALSCSNRVSQSEIPGTYVLERKTGSDTLWIYSDGRYLHSHSDNGKSFKEPGRWEYVGGEESRVAFHNYVERVESANFGAEPTTSTWIPFVERTLGGELRIALSEDAELYYWRLEPK
jgi:hypothetical protein